MNDLEKIIDKTMTSDEISKLFMSDKIMKNEMFLLRACTNELYLRRFLTGGGEYKLKYKDADDNLYFTNIDMVLSAFYSLYEKYPQYHFDKILEYSLNKFSKDEKIIYQIINIIYKQMENEAKNISPFKIVSIDMLKNSKESIKKVKMMFKSIKKYEALHRENGYMDVISDLNYGFKNTMNYDILDDNNDNLEKKTIK